MPKNDRALFSWPAGLSWLSVKVPVERSLSVLHNDRARSTATLTYPMSTGRNFDEILRLLDSCQLTADHKVATPVNWKQGEDVIIVPAVSDDEAKTKYPDGWKSPLPYLRVVPQPK